MVLCRSRGVELGVHWEILNALSAELNFTFVVACFATKQSQGQHRREPRISNPHSNTMLNILFQQT